ncbi:MAG: hypothetical protein EZS28_010712 [Streblomastix strix]|uniref:Uncharacterized protein n=1 Tax=Streblomastix strix TaxID=222440 RepID=A0A5J4WGT0_9EUKA|nr:MAG: hypothetical protein EZS28_010712 [Streblomastix strix]
MQLSEMEFLGIVIVTIVGYSTLHLIEVHRSMVLKLSKACWQMKTAMFKVHDTGVTVIFRPLEDLSIWTTQWLSSWMSRRKKKEEKLPIWWLYSKNRAASHEQTSKAVHTVMKANIRSYQGTQSLRSDLPQSLNQLIKEQLKLRLTEQQVTEKARRRLLIIMTRTQMIRQERDQRNFE